MKLAKTHFQTVYDAFGYSPGGVHIKRHGKTFMVVKETGRFKADRKTVRKLNKLHPCFGVKRIVFR